eukprot:tig00020902_g14985.t1
MRAAAGQLAMRAGARGQRLSTPLRSADSQGAVRRALSGLYIIRMGVDSHESSLPTSGPGAKPKEDEAARQGEEEARSGRAAVSRDERGPHVDDYGPDAATGGDGRGESATIRPPRENERHDMGLPHPPRGN